MILELCNDFDAARGDFNRLLPGLDFDKALQDFNGSAYAVPNFYAFPIYSDEGWNKFISFCKINY